MHNVKKQEKGYVWHFLAYVLFFSRETTADGGANSLLLPAASSPVFTWSQAGFPLWKQLVTLLRSSSPLRVIRSLKEACVRYVIYY